MYVCIHRENERCTYTYVYKYIYIYTYIYTHIHICPCSYNSLIDEPARRRAGVRETARSPCVAPSGARYYHFVITICIIIIITIVIISSSSSIYCY